MAFSLCECSHIIGAFSGLPSMAHPLMRALSHRRRGEFSDFVILQCTSRTSEIARFPGQVKAVLHCHVRERRKIASDLRLRAGSSHPQNPLFLGNFWQFDSVNAGVAGDLRGGFSCEKF